MIKYILLVVKIVLVLVILVAGVIGFLLFQTWQKNERPEVVAVNWDTESIMIGSAATLEVDFKIPWHRSISRAKPSRYPSGFKPLPEENASIVKGELSIWNGYRQWSVKVPMVAFEPKDPKGALMELPLNRTRRIPSPALASVFVPSIIVESPELPEDITDANQLLKPKPKQEIVEEVVEVKEPFSIPLPLLIAVGVIALLALITLLIVRRVKMGVPPWETALDELKDLEGKQQELEPVPFFSRLTDILKLYTADRFNTHSDAETATELLDSLNEIGQLPEGLDTMVQQADMIKFAGAEGSRDTYQDSLTAVRRFVQQTVPEEKN